MFTKLTTRHTRSTMFAVLQLFSFDDHKHNTKSNGYVFFFRWSSFGCAFFCPMPISTAFIQFFKKLRACKPTCNVLTIVHDCTGTDFLLQIEMCVPVTTIHRQYREMIMIWTLKREKKHVLVAVCAQCFSFLACCWTITFQMYIIYSKW